MNDTATSSHSPVTDLEIGRSPAGDTDWGQYIGDAVKRAAAGRRFRLLRHGDPVAVLEPYRPSASGYDPVTDLAALIDGVHAAASAPESGLAERLARIVTGPYARLRGYLLLDEPARQGVTTEAALREVLTLAPAAPAHDDRNRR